MKMELKEKLNLGSGKRKLVGYTNIDSDPNSNPDIVGNALNLNMIKDESVSEVYSEHLIEHFDIKEIDIFFNECRRILKPKGKFVVIVPDMEITLNRFCAGRYDLDYVDMFLFAHHRLREGCHMQGMYKAKLRRLCAKHSFKIIKMEHQDREHSMNEIVMEAVKEEIAKIWFNPIKNKG